MAFQTKSQRAAAVLPLPRVLVALVAFYAALSLVAQWRLGALAWSDSSPIEIFTDLLAVAAFGFAAVMVWRHRHDEALRRGWLSAAAGMAIIAIGETTDWFHDSSYDWYDSLPYEIALWLLAAFLVQRCTRLYAVQRHVRYWLLSGLAVQFFANVLEIAEDSAAAIPLGHFGTVRLTIEYTELLSLLCYVSALLFTQLGPRLVKALPRGLLTFQQAGAPFAAVLAAPAIQAVQIGTLARRQFHDQHLFRKPRYPTPYRALHWPGLRQAVTLGMMALFGGATAGKVSAGGCKPMWRQAVDMLRLGFGQGIDAFTYYLLELYRPGAVRNAGYYLTRYETKNGLFTALNGMRGRQAGVPHAMTDKQGFADICAAQGIATPSILIAANDGQVEIKCGKEKLDRDLFVKLRRGRGTKETERLHRIAPYRYVNRRGETLSLGEVLEGLRRRSMASDDNSKTALIVQPHLRNHASLADLAEQSLIAIRIVTCRNERDEPEVTHGMLRVLAKIEPDWDVRPDTEFGAAIDLRSGTLGAMTGDWPSSCVDWYSHHPITGAPVQGRRLEQWQALCELAVHAHRQFPNRIVVGWDLALTEDGPVILEGNANMDVSFIQRGYRQPIGRSRLGELLAHHLAILARQARRMPG